MQGRMIWYILTMDKLACQTRFLEVREKAKKISPIKSISHEEQKFRNTARMSPIKLSAAFERVSSFLQCHGLLLYFIPSKT